MIFFILTFDCVKKSQTDLSFYLKIPFCLLLRHFCKMDSWYDVPDIHDLDSYDTFLEQDLVPVLHTEAKAGSTLLLWYVFLHWLES